MRAAIVADDEGLNGRYRSPHSMLCDRYRYILRLEADQKAARRRVGVGRRAIGSGAAGRPEVAVGSRER